VFVSSRPLLRAVLLALLVVLPLGPSAALADQAASPAEAHALDLINQLRVAEGKQALRWDSRLADIAQWRSDYQVAHGFGHLSSWDPILDRMDAMGIIYIALGVAVDANGWYYWTGLLMHVPQTAAAPGPVAYMTGYTLGDKVDGKRRVTVSWSGENVSSFRLQKRVGSRRWRFVTDWTSATSRSLDLRVGRNYSFRVRGRDAFGNRSDWSVILRVAL
jgi:cysteine-rich secretory family protein